MFERSFGVLAHFMNALTTTAPTGPPFKKSPIQLQIRSYFDRSRNKKDTAARRVPSKMSRIEKGGMKYKQTAKKKHIKELLPPDLKPISCNQSFIQLRTEKTRLALRRGKSATAN